MKLEILLTALFSLCIVHTIGKVTGDLLKIEEGGSGTENETLVNTIEKINGGSKNKQIDVDTEGSGGSGSGYGDDEDDVGSGGSGSVPVRVYSTVSPTFKINTDRTNTSQTVVVINVGSTAAAVTEGVQMTPVVITESKVIVDSGDSELTNEVESTPDVPVDIDNNVIKTDKATGSKDESDSGINFTVAIVVGVVVGAILSILIIVFLVYRLRKKDEGSYSLDEPSSAMLPADSPHSKEKGDYYAWFSINVFY